MISDSILITGGLGFIGSHTSFELINYFKKIIIVDNCINSHINSYRKLKRLMGKKLIFFKADFFDQNLINYIIKKYQIKTVIHFAGLKSVNESINYPAKYYYNNVLGSKIFFNTLKKNNIENLIFSSSATVYGKPIYLPIDEQHPVKPINPYGQNKVDIENLLIKDSYFSEHCSVKILRYFNPIGAHPTGIIGENLSYTPNNIMPYILAVALGRFDSFGVYGNNYHTKDGTCIRDYIHIMDLIDAHIKALILNKKGITILNIGTGNGFSVLELIHSFSEINNIKIPYLFQERRLGDVSTVYTSPKFAENILGFKASRGIKEMCRDSWTFIKNNYAI